MSAASRTAVALAFFAIAASAFVACSGGAKENPAASPTVIAGDQLPEVLSFVPDSCLRIDPTADPRGGSPVCIVDRDDIQVHAVVRNVRQVRIEVTLGAQITLSTVIATPDSGGLVAVSVHLPRGNMPYVIQGAAVPSDARFPDTPLGAFRIMAQVP